MKKSLIQRIRDQSEAKCGHGKTLELKVRMRFGLMEKSSRTKLMCTDWTLPRDARKMQWVILKVKVSPS